MDESDAPVYHQVRQEQIAAGQTTQDTVDIPTVQEQVTVQGIPVVQVVEQIQEQIVVNTKQNAAANVTKRSNNEM